MLSVIKKAATPGTEVLESRDNFLRFRKKLVPEVCRGEVELFFIPAECFDAANLPLAAMDISIQKRQKGEVPGSEKLPDPATPLAADPCFLLNHGKNCLLCGFLETDIHLGRFELSSSGIRCIAEYHPAYRPDTETVYSQSIICLSGDDPSALLKEYAELTARHYNVPASPRFPRYAVGANWHYYGPTMTEEQLDEELNIIRTRQIPLDVYQIDDGWQKDYADWMPNNKWPSGMKQAADRIKAAGMIPGIWVTPFLCGDKSAASLPGSWLLRDSAGTPLTMKIGQIPFFILDPSNPETADFIRDFLLRIKSWGYRFFKIDFTRCLFLDPAAVPFDRSITLLQLYRNGIQLLRDTLGEECCLNLCGGHEGATTGLADVTRTGRDTYGKWVKPDDEAWIRIRQCVMRNWMTRFRMGDPDASVMRLNNSALADDLDYTPHRFAPNYAALAQGFLNDTEAETFILNQFLGGGIAEIGERLPDLFDERLALLRKVVPPYGEPAEPLDFFTLPLPVFYRSRITPACPGLKSWEIISAINVSDTPASLVYPGEFTNPTMVYDLSAMKLLGICHAGEPLSLPEIPPHGSKVLKFIELPGTPQPFFVADDLHYSGGGVEIASLTINGGTICGKLSSPWECEVQVAGAFPLPDGSYRIVTRKCRSNGEFSLTV